MADARAPGRSRVLMGGPSAEREISLISRQACRRVAREGRGRARVRPAGERSLLALQREQFRRAFIALHGRFGEDGTVQERWR